MSPEAALDSNVFLTYLAILLGLLAVAGGAIGSLGLLGKDVGHAWRAYRGWLVMIPLVLVCVFLGRLAAIAFFTLVAIVGFLANSKDAYGYLFYLIFAVEVNDVAAFTFGRTFGRHPLRSNISPKKTWEGSLGALAVSMVLPWLLWFSFPHFTPRELILSGLIVGVGGQLGDLAMSVIKRDLGIKDMGALIGGHGGILDRIDSLICVAPLWLNMARYFHEFY